MRINLFKVIRLFLGFFLYAVGIVMTINAGLGLSPWGVFHQGLSKTIGITMGQATIVTGFAIVTINSILGEKVGVGTLLNMIFVGTFMDILMLNNIIPIFKNITLKFLMLLCGMVTIGFATYFYLGVGVGSGPRDGLMVSIVKKTKKSVRLVRFCIETIPLIIGYILGGSVGIGTVIMAFIMGPIVQTVFRILKFDVKKVNHRFVNKDILFIKEKLSRVSK